MPPVQHHVSVLPTEVNSLMGQLMFQTPEEVHNEIVIRNAIMYNLSIYGYFMKNRLFGYLSIAK